MKFKLYIAFILLSLWNISGISQQIALEELFKEAEAKYWDAPAHAARVAEYILTQSDEPEIYARANLILGKSYLVQEKPFDAIKALFEAHSFAAKTANAPLQIETKLYSIQLLQKLALTTISEEIRAQLNKFRNGPAISEEIDNQLLLIDAETALAHEEFATAQRLFNTLDPNFIGTDSIRKIRHQLGLARLKFIASEFRETAAILDHLSSDDIPKYFRVAALNLSAQLYFKNNDFDQAISTWKKAKEMASQLPNNDQANQSLEGLIQVYLIQENSEKYLGYKQESNLLTAELTTDRVRAVNFAYNQFVTINEQSAKTEVVYARKKIVFTAGFSLILIAILLGIYYYYRLRIKEYQVLKKLLASPTPVSTRTPIRVQKKISIEKNLVSEETEKQLLEALKVFESGTDFTRSDMSIAVLAARLNTNIKYLSDVINRHKGKNFNGYINELRVNYIINKLKTDPIYLNYKISYLAEESGFSSHSSFTTVFKSVTGISPTKFLGFLQKEGVYED